MTRATMALTELAKKTPDADGLRQMIRFLAQRMMGEQIGQKAGKGAAFAL